ncbi:MAG: 2,3-bisphosphoglycerate-independent phosphoglycerate mutase [Clostridiales bacterium]|nr:2,3-bisphosphoglycerate-independent phosphoglycerate mutase [Clostridiales bacterium]
MEWEDLAKELTVSTASKIVLLVIDGLGDLPVDGKTPLEKAKTPNLDCLARKGVCGLTDPVLPGITPGSGPSHLALFGYDPLRYQLGRGILEALGSGVEVGQDDLVARGNYATLKNGLVWDRRAGRIPTSENEMLCRQVNQALKPKPGLSITLYPGKEHRFVVKFSGPGLEDALSDADPQKDQKPRAYTQPLAAGAAKTAEAVNAFLDEVTEILSGRETANTVLLRGFSKFPSLPSMSELYKLKPAACANYPMYKGLARLLGMDVLDVGAETADLFSALEAHYGEHDFFYVHYKKTDAAGEDGNAQAKTRAIEEVDAFIPRLEALAPDVLVVTSDHSTPCLLKSHSWHPNPFVLVARAAFPDDADRFSERACSRGFLGRFPSLQAMPLMLAHAGKLKKFGA